ncbi:MAG: endonuclease domain-containing protein [Paludibacteraceae bacterium]|nr:endonuclease domain-containing protein [Paludibacteraceae bacterium]
MLCAYCGKDILKKLPQHLMVAHGKTLRENTILINNLDPENLPKCPYCGMDVMIDRIVHPTCSMLSCIEKQKAVNRHNGQVLENQRRVREGTSNLLKQNLKYDEQGRSLMHLNSYRSRMINGNLQAKTSALEERVFNYIKSLYPFAVSQFGIPGSPSNHPYDVFIPQLRLLIEVDGAYWHDPIEDKRWDDLAASYGYKVERISWDENQYISDDELKMLIDGILSKYISRHNFSVQETSYMPAMPPQSMMDEEFGD